MAKKMDLLDFLLLKLSEEAVKVSHIVHKTVLYGTESQHPEKPEGFTNARVISTELMDMMTIHDMLNKYGLPFPELDITHPAVLKEMKAKRLKMLEWLRIGVKNDAMDMNLYLAYENFLKEFYGESWDDVRKG